MTSRWSTPLARPVGIIGGTELRTLSDARSYLLGLDERRAGFNAWQCAGRLILSAADGGDVEAATTQLEFALMMDGRWRMR